MDFVTIFRLYWLVIFVLPFLVFNFRFVCQNKLTSSAFQFHIRSLHVFIFLPTLVISNLNVLISLYQLLHYCLTLPKM